MAYLGNLEGTGFSKVDSQRFNGNNSDTQFTMRHNVGMPEHIEVYVENVRQDPFTAYTVSGKTLTFTGTPPTGTGNIYVVYIGGAINTFFSGLYFSEKRDAIEAPKENPETTS